MTGKRSGSDAPQQPRPTQDTSPPPERDHHRTQVPPPGREPRVPFERKDE
ncbi:MAG: hypothetical protein WBB98_13315 [Xanthobacteraceae bacterium]